MRSTGIDLSRLRRDFPYFAEAVLGLDLWRGQKAASRSEKFITVLVAPRRVGKSTLIEALAIWTCFREPNARVLIVSAGESSAQDRIEGASRLLSRNELTEGSTADEFRSRIDFKNGSVLVSKPASEKAIRGMGAGLKLLVVDEAAWVNESVWDAAQFTALDEKPNGARIVIACTPWGSREHFFRRHYEMGTARDHPDVASFKWDWNDHPNPDWGYLKRRRDVMADARYRSDVLGEWVDDSESLFPFSLLEGATADFEQMPPEACEGLAVLGGIDYGFARDLSALVTIAGLPDLGLNDDESRVRFVVNYAEWYRPGRIDPGGFVRRVASTARRDKSSYGPNPGFRYELLTSEENGIGQMPTSELIRAVDRDERDAIVYRLHTSQESKAIAFGRLRALMADGRLILPRVPELLQSLGSLHARITDRGGVSIEVIDSNGTHADLAMALAQATGPWARERRSGCKIAQFDGNPYRVVAEDATRIRDLGEIVESSFGVRLPARPFFADLDGPFIHRAGDAPYRARQYDTDREDAA